VFYAFIGIVLGGVLRRAGAIWWAVIRISFVYAIIFAIALIAVAQAIGLNTAMLMNMVQNTTQAALQSARLVLGPNLLFGLGRMHPLSLAALGYLLLCLMCSLLSYTASRHIVTRLG
jgi:hypothetical protein